MASLVIGYAHVFGCDSRHHVTPLLRDRLHWLQARERISFKLCLLVYPGQACNLATLHFVSLVRSPRTVSHCTFVSHLHYQLSKTSLRLVPASLTNRFAEYEQRTLYGALILTPAMLQRLINCHFIIIFIICSTVRCHCHSALHVCACVRVVGVLWSRVGLLESILSAATLGFGIAHVLISYLTFCTSGDSCTTELLHILSWVSAGCWGAIFVRGGSLLFEVIGLLF